LGWGGFVFCVGCGWGKELVLQLGRIFRRIGVWFPHKLLWISLCCFCFGKLGYCCKFFIKQYTWKFDMHTFVHIYHVLKIENWHIHNRQNNLFKKKNVTGYCSKIDFFGGIHILLCSFFFFWNLYWYPHDRCKSW
jgi:hypothetical protein